MCITINNEQSREPISPRKYSLEYCLNIQYIDCVVGKDVDMSDKKERFQQALELIIDGLSLSETGAGRVQAGRYILTLLVSDNPGLLDAEKIKAIQSIIAMADEQESPAFRL